jgi:glycosyltransferase involved in cell wall biosynthesis
VRDGCAHRFLSVHLTALTSAAVTVKTVRPPTPRALVLAASIAWRQLTGDPVRAVLLAGRVLPPRFRGALKIAGPYGTAAALWRAGDRTAALAALDQNPRRLAAFALAADQIEAARAAIVKLPENDAERPYLAANLAWREGRLTDAIRALDAVRGYRARGRRATRLRHTLTAQQAAFTVAEGTAVTAGGLGGGTGRAAARGAVRVLHIVTDALPNTSAGYTIRTHEIARAQRDAGLDPHVVTALGFPVTKGDLDGRRRLTLDGVPYHRLLPWTMPPDTDSTQATARLTGKLRPAVLHAASNYKNAQVALSLRDQYGIPVVYEVRGFWEDTWLSRHPADEQALRRSELYEAIRGTETACMLAADLVVTLGAAMRDEIVARGIPESKIEIVPNAVAESFLQPLPKRQAPGDGYTIGTVTTLVPHEGIGTLLAATKILRERDIPAHALIVGDGPDKAALERQADSLGIPATFTGRVPAARVREFHALLDVFVVPRTRDRVCQLVTPLKPVEAMASGLCVVTSELSALAEIVKHQVTGALTMPQDPVSLADCLEWLFYSPDIRTKLGTAAREWVAADRTWARNAARYREAYQRLIGS